MSTRGYLAWMRDGKVDVGSDVILELIRDRMAVAGIQAAAVPEVAVVHQERGPAGAGVEEPFFGGRGLRRDAAGLLTAVNTLPRFRR